MNEIMHHTGMARMQRKDFLEYGRRPHVNGEIAALLGTAQNCQCIECRCIDIGGITLMQACHVGHVFEIALLLGPIAIQSLNGAEIKLLPIRGSLQLPGRGRGAESGQNFQCRVTVLLMPNAVILGHCLAPVGHGKARIDFLRLAKMQRCILVFKVVQLGEPAEKFRLGRRSAGVLETLLRRPAAASRTALSIRSPT